MLDGIVDQLEDCQRHGIWAWDSCNNELGLLIPSVLAMLGENPMQRRFFCRVCWVKGVPDEDEDDDGNGNLSDASSVSGASSASGVNFAPKGQAHNQGKKKKKKKGLPWNREESLEELRSQFTAASVVGGQASFKQRKTESGIKDTFQGAFLEHVFAVSTRKKRSKVQKQADTSTMLQTFPADITSPDTHVEILHVILLGFVKYFWRDAVARVKKADKDILISRLSSFEVSGLGISKLPGHTLVNYSGSLTGRDFRTIVQAAPFVLQGLLLPEYIELWAALSSVVTLVWQPHIPDLKAYTDRMNLKK
ncbi:hypothetical protein K438DRAFT_1787523 [Mycena galopus ATCC 62051]|nr:hypothetical protein K438DRAFT_1787523 [Mycena galopus ATCC 62051]